MVILLRDSDEALSDSNSKGSLSERKRQDLSVVWRRLTLPKLICLSVFMPMLIPVPAGGRTDLYNKNSTEAKLLARVFNRN